MCKAILRVTYGTNDVRDIPTEDVERRIEELRTNDQVRRIEVFTKCGDLQRETVWTDTFTAP